ncbi:T9SS sorting signal type C domain-containing protein [Flavobacterium gawalongense]|uniref:T9SS sorting signal type C domain-containing protein n=1 Tax=Flavobacterium gawalongense TaxID=2594432 RepID=A0A553BDR9_9FLAO|nr:T9SS sorting signal type C domain-containing protein [Flavobacterium gawalongense]TRX06393.1 T9SS sorting signal type C domain-containing protein [Flavobacterium gawalongense]TRX12738.1 T9SS sorting signal type C domain-containing protein [Flavobacterium gawalongense]TRX30473.1 T9SS sorting signal type C domain-containing protein [Flavobacterium gawalongense]
MIKKLLFTIFLLLVQTVVLAQTLGDYRSNVTSGNWTTLASWQYYNGSSWVTPSGTSPQGYPGQFTGTGTVTIRNSHTITISASTSNNFTALIIGEGISGTLVIGADVNVETLSTKINAGGIITFSGNNEIRFPVNATIIIDSPGKIDNGGTCNNNVAVYIGDTKYAVCKGSGNAEFSFEEINLGGGSIIANPVYSFPICGNTTVLSGSYSGAKLAVYPVTYKWSGSGLTFSPSDTAQSPTVSTSTSGTYSLRLTVTNGNYSNYKEITIIFNALPTTPTVTPTQPTCSLVTGKITVNTPVPASGITYTVTGTSPVVASVSNTTGLFSGLTVGNYTVTTTNASGCISSGTSITINTQVIKTWNGSAWSTGSVPTSSEKIIFAGNYSSSSDLVACSCQVNSGAVVINSSNTLTLTNELVVSGGSLTFENNSSLVQINNTVVNTGVITYKRNNTTTRETDYTYWSSPVAGQTLKNASPDTLSDKYYSFDAVADDWNQEDSANVMLVGIGYIIRGPHYTSIPPPGFYEAPFNGTPNNGAFSLTGIIADKSYLIGNPYPSALDADKFLTDNNSVLDGTLYFWTHNTAIGIGVSNPGTGIYAYSSDDYASYNLTGGVGTGNFVGLDEQISNKPSGKIASGQGFFASSKLVPASSEIVFNNSMRIGVGGITGNNSQFFKITKSSKTTSAIEKHRVWLNLTNAQGAFKQALVGYVTNATNEYDNAFDGESFDGNQFVDFYSVNEDKNLTIQGRALPFKENDEVPLGYSSTINGTFSIAIDQVDGVLSSQNVFIEDKLTNVIHDLKESSYSFVTEAGIFNNRFVLRYTNTITNKTLGTGDFETLDNTVLVSNKNKQIKINSSVQTIDKVQVYDLLGRSIYQKINVDANELAISNLVINHQVLLVKIGLQNGKIVTKKIGY